MIFTIFNIETERVWQTNSNKKSTCLSLGIISWGRPSKVNRAEKNAHIKTGEKTAYKIEEM